MKIKTNLLNLKTIGSLLILVLQLLAFQSLLSAQFYVKESRVISPSSFPRVQQVYNNNLYIIGSTSNTSFPTTDSSTITGSNGLFFLKFDSLSTLVAESKVSEYFYAEQMFIKNDIIYVFGTAPNQLPSHTQVPSSGKNDVYILKLDLDGNLLEATYFGGNKSDSFNSAAIHGNTISLVLSTYSIDIPVTDNSTYKRYTDLVYAQFDLTTLNLNFATYLGGDGDERYGILQTQGTSAYIAYETTSTNLPGAGSDTLNGYSDIAISKIDLSSGNLLSTIYLGGSNWDYPLSFIVQDSELSVYIETNSPDFPLASPSPSYNWTAFARLDTSLNQIVGTYLTYLDELSEVFFVKHNGFYYSVEYEEEDEAELIKFDKNGIIQWRYAPDNNMTTIDLKIYDDKIYYLNYGSQLPVTQNCTYTGANHLEILSQDGDIMYSNFYPVKSSYIKWAFIDSLQHFLVGRSYNSYNNCLPTTDSSQGSGLYTQLVSFEVPEFLGDPNPDNLTQTVCKNGLVDPIRVDPYMVSGTTLPILYECGIPLYQCDIEALYQWQQSNSTSGPWTDIPGGNNANFSPTPVVTTTYYRRLARANKCFNGPIIQTSTIHSVIVNQYQAPYVDAGGVYFSCPGTPVTLNSTISSGTPPFQYSWHASNSATTIGSTANITVTPAQVGSVIYTLYVTDANGCEQLDQAIVHSVIADAGSDIYYCAAQPAPSIGGGSIPIQGVTYQWSPATGLSCANCLHPVATPTVSTLYTLTMTMPVTGNASTCVTTDQVTVIPVDAPAQNFAGVDIIGCGGDNTSIGGAAESGFFYKWSTGYYLTNCNATPTIFNRTCISPNPSTFTLTATNQGCTWEDDMELTVLCTGLGYISCGPGVIGHQDNTPNINETYQWTQLSGDGMIVGPTNTAQTSVSPSITMTSVYEREVSYGGTTCTSTISVPPCANPAPSITQLSSCLNLNTNPDACINISIFGIPYPNTIVWSPQIGLSNYNNRFTCLTDTIHRTYTVTVTSDNDSTISATTMVEVNNPFWITPEFEAIDTIVCPNEPVNIGQPGLVGYTYLWSPQTGLDDHSSANPIATVSTTTQFIVRVTNTNSGCMLRDTAVVGVSPVYADAGDDVVLCDNGTIVLGVPAQPNAIYSWQPSGAVWQNGTDQFSAQPEVLVGTNTTFTLTVQDTLNDCVDTDLVNVSVGNPIVPFLLQDITYCSPQNSIQLGVGVPSGYASYQWSPSLNLSNPSIPMPTLITPSSIPVEYTVIATNQSGCTSIAKQLVSPNTVEPIVESPKSICAGESVYIGSNQNITGPGITYSWSPITDIDDPTSPNPLVTGSASGSTLYTVTVNNNGCTNSASIEVTVNAFEISLSSKIVCAGSCVSIGAQPVTGSSYLWVPAYGLDDPTLANPKACVMTDTVYTLYANGPTGCQTIVDVPIYVHPESAPQVTVPPLSVCLGSGQDTLKPIVAPTGSYTYNWAPNNGTLDYPNAETPSVVLFSAGTHTYDVTVTNTISGCASESSVVVTAGNCNDPAYLCSNLDVCLEIGIDPDHPLTTIDCDGDGVTNEDECADGTDPLDPCDYVDTSITLPVTADQSGCPPTCPDLTPTVRILPGNLSGNSVIQVAVRISEVHNIDTDATVISVRIPSDPRLLFVWDIGLTFAAFTSVQNPDWNYLGDNGVFHTWTYNGPGLIIDGLSTSAFGFIGFYDPQGTDGQTNITATVFPFSGGECNLTNNSDSELLIYFQ